MARAATTSGVFNAIAEPQRREILTLLCAGDRPAGEAARELGPTQPGASKHLRVLREVGLVHDRKCGKQRVYGPDARGLRPIHEWAGGFEEFWNESLGRLDASVRQLAEHDPRPASGRRTEGEEQRQIRPTARSWSHA